MRITALLLMLVLAGVVAALLTGDALNTLDGTLNAFWTPYRGKPLLAAFAWLTYFGAGQAVMAAVIVASGLLWAAGQRRDMAALWITGLGAEATTWSLKFLIDRTRPTFLDVATAVSPSFPSGHTALSLAVYGLLAWLIARRLVTRPQRAAVIGFASVLIASIAFSRIFIGVHYASDVLAGLSIGGFWLLVGIDVARRGTALNR